MPKKSKLATPNWIKEGYNSEEEYNKKMGIDKKNSGHRSVCPKLRNAGAKTFKIRECPKCRSDDVNVVLTGDESRGTGEWECKKCKWQGVDIVEKEFTEDELMKYLDEKGEEVL